MLDLFLEVDFDLVEGFDGFLPIPSLAGSLRQVWGVNYFGVWGRPISTVSAVAILLVK